MRFELPATARLGPAAFATVPFPGFATETGISSQPPGTQANGLAGYGDDQIGGNTPITTPAKYFQECDVQNRLQGDAGLLTVAMPFRVAQQ